MADYVTAPYGDEWLVIRIEDGRATVMASCQDGVVADDIAEALGFDGSRGGAENSSITTHNDRGSDDGH